MNMKEKTLSAKEKIPAGGTVFCNQIFSSDEKWRFPSKAIYIPIALAVAFFPFGLQDRDSAKDEGADCRMPRSTFPPQ